MTLRSTRDPDVFDNTDEHAYELHDGEEVIGLAAYVTDGESVVLTHTTIEPALRGKDLGSRLVKAALDDIASQDKTVTPTCPFVAAYIRRHPSYAGLVRE